MSLDPLCLAAAATVGPAAGLVLLTSSCARFSARAFLAARRLLRASLLLALLLAAIATFRWSDATMGASTSLPGPPAPTAPGRPPLVGFLVLAVVAWAARAVALRRRGGVASRLGIRRRRRLEQRAPLGLVGGHALPVPGARRAAGGPVVAPPVPTGCRERRAADRRVGAEPV
ncbi:hypothetical protein [Streptacidiphilus pinicola]|uniref:hypothetical protein n=1 Tax=Streptacidiphilus pinicola TaxID=2219663 RepID=UPI001FB3F235|nr:hypothetical protein [Streptacidiphilus pinicola]